MRERETERETDRQTVNGKARTQEGKWPADERDVMSCLSKIALLNMAEANNMAP